MYQDGSYYSETVNTEILPTGSIEEANLLMAVDNTPTALAGKLTYNALENKTVAAVSVTLDKPEDANLSNLIMGSYLLDGVGAANSKLAASIDGGETLLPLLISDDSITATVEIDASEFAPGDSARTYAMEFYYLDENHENAGILFGRYAAFTVNPPIPLTSDKLSISTPDNWLETIYANDPTADSALTLKANVNSTGCTWNQTRWVSSDESIAIIDSDGVIHPLSTGEVEFYLKALNGDINVYQETGYCSGTVKLKIKEGGAPYLRIPEASMSIRSGDAVALR